MLDRNQLSDVPCALGSSVPGFPAGLASRHRETWEPSSPVSITSSAQRFPETMGPCRIQRHDTLDPCHIVMEVPGDHGARASSEIWEPRLADIQRSRSPGRQAAVRYSVPSTHRPPWSMALIGGSSTRHQGQQLTNRLHPAWFLSSTNFPGARDTLIPVRPWFQAARWATAAKVPLIA